MFEIPDVTHLKEAVSLFAPGMILLALYLRVQGGPTPSLQNRLLGYAVASTTYVAVVSPFFTVEGGLELPVWIWSLLQNFIVPAMLGWLLAFASQRDGQYRAAKVQGGYVPTTSTLQSAPPSGGNAVQSPASPK